jgi:succinate dehydrogenase / fumarate reductase cytochrome b subunit
MLPRSTVGKKIVMAATGVILVGFVVIHMVGNLKVYLGAEHFNAYARFLREVAEPLLGYSGALWGFRVVLLACVVLHVAAAYQLTRLNRAARPVGYAAGRRPASYAAWTMRWGGVVLLLFVVYHLLHFTLGSVGYGPGQFRHLDAYNNVVIGFRVWYVSLFYVAAMLALGLHLWHGTWSMFQTLGVIDPRWQRAVQAVGAVLAVVVVAGNVSVPLAVLTGLLR